MRASAPIAARMRLPARDRRVGVSVLGAAAGGASVARTADRDANADPRDASMPPSSAADVCIVPVLIVPTVLRRAVSTRAERRTLEASDRRPTSPVGGLPTLPPTSPPPTSVAGGAVGSPGSYPNRPSATRPSATATALFPPPNHPFQQYNVKGRHPLQSRVTPSSSWRHRRTWLCAVRDTPGHGGKIRAKWPREIFPIAARGWPRRRAVRETV